MSDSEDIGDEIDNVIMNIGSYTLDELKLITDEFDERLEAQRQRLDVQLAADAEYLKSTTAQLSAMGAGFQQPRTEPLVPADLGPIVKPRRIGRHRSKKRSKKGPTSVVSAGMDGRKYIGLNKWVALQDGKFKSNISAPVSSVPIGRDNGQIVYLPLLHQAASSVRLRIVDHDENITPGSAKIAVIDDKTNTQLYQMKRSDFDDKTKDLGTPKEQWDDSCRVLRRLLFKARYTFL
ncbi:uncharacterized protein EHS24_005473 [Apiotrichum porosum]|uniref:Uncharacterized protein n=1 Tax=Apiotrichum porosum TaxID=105984 RepID=A0A427XCM1_9TREE|nr:uncharacterized protein EHS24_005473 [Apiotrichum porosum]RSH76588.1 hypothetical protein EHS24_005473 [Apiotrichum porosum]